MSHRNGGEFSRTANRAALAPPVKTAPVFIGDNGHFGNWKPSYSVLDHDALLDLVNLLHVKNISTSDVKQKDNMLDCKPKGIPSGYTYLLQLVAHDLVFTVEEVGTDRLGYNHKGNLRRVQLQLETILGGGPKVCPHIFDQDNNGQYKLRHGNFRDIEQTEPPWSGPKGDLGRFAFSASGALTDLKGAKHSVLLADPRNDDNPILSQLTVLFLRLFNHLSDSPAKSVADGNWHAAAGETVMIFQRLILQDLLPRILMPEVLQYYKGKPKWLEGKRRNGSVSFEFAFAAGRIAHSMIRPIYQLNECSEVGLQALLTPDKNGHPMRKDWEIDWSLFFTDTPELAPCNFNWATKFGPHMSIPLYQDTSAPAPNLNGKATVAGVVFRDLLRGEDIEVMRPADFADLIQEKKSPLAKLECLKSLLSSDARESLVTEELKILSNGTEFGEKNIQHIATNPPLLLYLMLEAQSITRGRTLGPLGSIIFAETFRKIFQERGQIKDYQAGPLEKAQFGEAGIRTMSQLTKEISKLSRYKSNEGGRVYVQRC